MKTKAVSGTKFFAGAALLVLVHTAAFAGGAAELGGIGNKPETRIEHYLYGKVEYFTWEEFDAGQRLLKESGPRYGVGYAPSFISDPFTFRPRVEFFGGTVDYDGQTQAGTPVQTDTEYWGFTAEGTVGGVIGLTEKVQLEPLAGLGYDYWERDLKSTATAIGYTEKWHNFFAKLGLRAEYSFGSGSRVKGFAEGGVKWPFATRYEADIPGIGHVKVSPGEEPAPFAEAGLVLGRLKGSVYYEGMRFSKSDEVPVPAAGVVVFQPESEADIVGVRLGWLF